MFSTLESLTNLIKKNADFNGFSQRTLLSFGIYNGQFYAFLVNIISELFVFEYRVISLFILTTMHEHFINKKRHRWIVDYILCLLKTMDEIFNP